MGPVNAEGAKAAIETFVVAYLLGGEAFAQNPFQIRQLQHRLVQQYPNLNETSMWVQDLRRMHDLELHPRLNPFVERVASFDSIAELALEFGHRFGSFQNLECHKL